MNKFCDYSVLIFPKEESYYTKSLGFKNNLKKGIFNFIKLCNGIGIETQCFITNTVAWDIRPAGVKWLMPLTMGDAFALRKLDPDDYYTLDIENCNYITKEISIATKKFPLDNSNSTKVLNNEQRFNLIQKRERLAVNEYLKHTNFIITFESKNNKRYSVNSKSKDIGKVVVEIKENNLYAHTYMSGKELDPLQFYENETTVLPVYKWEV